MDFKEKLNQFLNSMVAKGASVAEVDAARTFYLAHPTLIQPMAEGVLAQDELSRRLGEVSTLENSLRTKETQWNTYLQRANDTLSVAEREKLEATQRAAQADTAIKALAAQYNIPEDDVRAIYNPTSPSTQQQQTAQQLLEAARARSQASSSTQQTQSQSQAISREDLVGLIEDMGKKDAINSRHFALTGKPWNSLTAMNYIKEQASLGRQVDIEQAWRVTENIDSLEATATEAAKKAERDQIEREIREKIATEAHNPLDAAPQFAEAHLSSIFQSTQENADPNARKEVTGHHGRTREAVAALNRLQTARRLGQKSPYEQVAQ